MAAQLTFTCVQMSDAAAIRRAAVAGVGGIALFGSPGANLAGNLEQARQAASLGIPPVIASDEEGGEVQRLAAVIYPLPSAEVMGSWPTTRITAVAYAYARRMRTLGITMDFGPDADLSIAGYYIADFHRSFARDPNQVARDVTAWDSGLRRAGVIGVVKHWPGHGQASNTHIVAATDPDLAVLERRDMLPFQAAFAAEVPAVMVGHLRVPGLTRYPAPASESTAALRYLRASAGPQMLIITDDLSMAAASSALGITAATAAVRALQSGADMALGCQTPVSATIDAISQAIETGRLPRQQAVESARRILRVKNAYARHAD